MRVNIGMTHRPHSRGMIDAALAMTALLMGLAGAPHCMAMCGAASSAVVSRCGKRGGAAFHVSRVAAYSAAGAVAASSVLLVKTLGEAAPLLRPLWTLLQVAVFAWGAWLLVKGRQPVWMSAQSRALSPQPARDGWTRIAGPARAAAVGATWVAWPCGLLHSGLLVAALASSPVGGALVMGSFAASSSAGLWAASMLWTPGGLNVAGSASAVAKGSQRVTRVSGALMMAAAGWALGAGLWQRVAALCVTA